MTFFTSMRSLLLAAFFFIVFFNASSLNAAEKSSETPSASSHKSEKALQPEEDDYGTTPFTEYGEFNEEEDEAEEARFLQQGRLFGVSLGSGFEGSTGNRGAFWKGGTPMFDLRIHYWFDFNVGLALGVYSAPHYFDAPGAGGHTSVTNWRIGVDLKYYFDVRNLSAPVSFANPYVLIGGGSYSKYQSSDSEGTTDPDTTMGLCVGGGLEFPIKHRRIYLNLEAKAHMVSFKDTFTTKYKNSNKLDNLQGTLFTVTGGIAFTW